MTIREFLKNNTVKNILSALAVAVFGFILLNLTFLLDASYQVPIRRIVGHFAQIGPESTRFFPFLMHGSFAAIICIISYFVFRSRMRVLFKAIYMTVPAATVLATVGILSYQTPIIGYCIGGILCFGTLYYFYRTKQPWLYYYTVIFVGLGLAIFTLLGGEI